MKEGSKFNFKNLKETDEVKKFK